MTLPTLTIIKTFPKFIAQLYLKQIGRLEKQIGYKLIFSKLAPAWINGIMPANLTKDWQKFGLDVIGVDYFTMGKIIDGFSSRFDPNSKYYQSWLGGYLVKFNQGKGLTVQEHYNLAVVDQIDWLRHYGDPKPVCELHPSGFIEAGQLMINEYPAKLYVGGGVSHSDVGSNNKRLNLRFLAAFIATVFNQNNLSLNLKSENFVPKQTKNSYADVYLKGYIIIVEIADNTQAVLYGNGAVFADAEGKQKDNFEMIKDELFDSLKKIIVTKI